MRRRITKALAAKRSRKQHGLFVQQLNEECESLHERIEQLRLRREADAVARDMVLRMQGALAPDKAQLLQQWIQSTPLEGLICRAEERERERLQERLRRLEQEEKRGASYPASLNSSPAVTPPPVGILVVGLAPAGGRQPPRGGASGGAAGTLGPLD